MTAAGVGAAVPVAAVQPPRDNAILRRRRRELVVGAAVLALLAVLPLPIHDVYTRNLIILTLMYAGLAQAWNVLGGYCGQISLGHALYFGIGAYTSTLLFVAPGRAAEPGPVRGRRVGRAGVAAGRLAVLPAQRPLLRHRHRRGRRDRLPLVPELGLRGRRHRRVRAVHGGELGRAAVPHDEAALPLRHARLPRGDLDHRLADRGVALGLLLARGEGRRGGGAQPRRARVPEQDGRGRRSAAR